MPVQESSETSAEATPYNCAPPPLSVKHSSGEHYARSANLQGLPEMSSTSYSTPNHVTSVFRQQSSTSPSRRRKAGPVPPEATLSPEIVSGRPGIPHPQSDPGPIRYPKIPKPSEPNNDGTSNWDPETFYEHPGCSEAARNPLSSSDNQTDIPVISDECSDPSTPCPPSRQAKANATLHEKARKSRLSLGNKRVDHGSTDKRIVLMPASPSGTACDDELPGMDRFRDTPQRRARSYTQTEDRKNLSSPGLSSSSDPADESDQSSSMGSTQTGIGPPFKKKLDKNLLLETILSDLFHEIGKLAATEKYRKPWNDGFIYVFQIPHCPEYVKIGWTRGNPENRRKELEKCCKGLEMIGYEGAYITVPFCYRVEQLIHLDLANTHHRFVCSVCKKSTNQNSKHGEWFKIDPHEAIFTVKRWKAWMYQRPYDASGNLKLLWQNWIETLKDDKTYNYSKTIVDEDRAGTRWKTFLSEPSIAKELFVMKRQDSIARTLDSRWERMGRNKVKIIIYCFMHWAVPKVFLEIFGSVPPSIFPWVILGTGLVNSIYWM